MNILIVDDEILEAEIIQKLIDSILLYISEIL